MEACIVDNVPQWKKDLIARLRNQNKSFSNRDHHSAPHHSLVRTVQQPNLTAKSLSISVASDVSRQTDAPVDEFNVSPKMVQERVWVDNKSDHFADMVSENYANNGYHKGSDSDSSEELHYGPGIVKKLKNKYLSLALRENNRRSILHMRKATSLENLLEDDVQENKSNGHYESRLNGPRNAPLRYRSTNRHPDVKRARSVEGISRLNSEITDNDVVTNRQSFNEEMLIAAQKEGNDYNYRKTQDNTEFKPENKFNQRINRPKRLQPIMNEKEKPPADVVKQAKMIFERRPEQRTKKPPQTGDVAAKVDCYNNIIVKTKVEAKVTRKPQIKGNKPVISEKKSGSNRSPTKTIKKPEDKLPPKPSSLNKVPQRDLKDITPPSPSPDVSRILPGESELRKPQSSLSETPDLILTSSPLPPLHFLNTKQQAEKREDPVNEHHKLTSPLVSPNRVKPASPLISPSYNRYFNPILSPIKLKPTTLNFDDDEDITDFSGTKKVSPTSINKISKESSSVVFKFNNKEVNQDHLPVNKNVSEVKVPTSELLKIEVNGHVDTKPSDSGDKLLQPEKQRSPPKFTPPPPPVEKKIEKTLTVTEIEKNSINVAKSSGGSENGKSVEVVNKNVVPKKVARHREPVSESSFVINFVGTKRDVPDYISNDTWRATTRPELPKPGEGGIILIPGATILESFTDEDEEILRSLEGPPSPCDVTFINDNMLIDGKSSLCQKVKQRTKLKISFVDSGPDVFEYPSETSMMLDDSPLLAPVQLGHTVPNLSGSSLANYKPKGTEKFQPGVTKSIPQPVPSPPKNTETESDPNYDSDEIDKPFSSGGSSDILF